MTKISGSFVMKILKKMVQSDTYGRCTCGCWGQIKSQNAKKLFILLFVVTLFSKGVVLKKLVSQVVTWSVVGEKNWGEGRGKKVGQQLGNLSVALTS